jgi:PrsW family intramembrane metalloprotease
MHHAFVAFPVANPSCPTWPPSAGGGLVATSAAISGSAALQDILAKVSSPQVAAEWGPAVAGAYGALVGLGFQVVENIVFAVNAVALHSGRDQVAPVVVTFLLRSLLGPETPVARCFDDEATCWYADVTS